MEQETDTQQSQWLNVRLRRSDVEDVRATMKRCGYGIFEDLSSAKIVSLSLKAFAQKLTSEKVTSDRIGGMNGHS